MAVFLHGTGSGNDNGMITPLGKIYNSSGNNTQLIIDLSSLQLDAYYAFMFITYCPSCPMGTMQINNNLNPNAGTTYVSLHQHLNTFFHLYNNGFYGYNTSLMFFTQAPFGLTGGNSGEYIVWTQQNLHLSNFVFTRYSTYTFNSTDYVEFFGIR